MNGHAKKVMTSKIKLRVHVPSILMRELPKLSEGHTQQPWRKTDRVHHCGAVASKEYGLIIENKSAESSLELLEVVILPPSYNLSEDFSTGEQANFG